MTEVLLGGRGLLESIRWHDDQLFVSDWSAGEVLAVPGDVVATVASLPLCFDWLPDGRMLLVSSADGLLLREDLVPHATLGAGTWHDIVVDRRGHVFVNQVDFTGPGTIHLAGVGEWPVGWRSPTG